ncbi:uncharacterized protein [Drosophila pseudoobscura]|uniref:Single domain-containing protein n=1 Tax=Drosophila pseudoobscura pseudoobscura TaxID=46245 RepID=A0A6I8V924_DROPS|nr:uncharacterized protein LOC26532189 [Drosophila pseudoobscura]
MHFAGILLVLSALFLAGTEADSMQAVFSDPEHPGKCVIDGLILSDGQWIRHPKMCALLWCGRNSIGGIHICGKVSPPPGSRFGEYTDPKADYPACCRREIIE